MDELITRYRRSINPPYKAKDYLNLFLTFIVLLALPLTVFLAKQQQDIRQRAQTVDRGAVRGQAGDLWADIVVGQRDFTEINPREITPDKVFSPGGVIVDRSNLPAGHPGRAYIWDSGNNRILGLDLQTCYSRPAGTRCSAQIVIGQPSTSDHGGCNQDSSFQNYPQRASASASTVCGVYEGTHTVVEDKSQSNMFVDSQGNLYVPDSLNNRVLKYISPFTTDTVADDVWGQPDFSGNECNITGSRLKNFYSTPTASSLCFQGLGYGSGVTIDAQGNMWVADGGNNRVVRFPFNLSTGQIAKSADLVLGQSNFTSAAGGRSMNQLSGPNAVAVDSSGSVYVADTGNYRVLVFQSPLTSGMTATRTFGREFDHPDPHASSCNPTTGAGCDINPYDIQLDPQGRGIWSFEAYSWGQRVRLWSADGSTIQAESSNTNGALGGRGLGSIGIDNLGHIITSSYFYSEVYHFAPQQGGTLQLIQRLFSPPWGANLPSNRRFEHTSMSGVAVAANQLFAADSRLLFWDNASALTNGQPVSGHVGRSSLSFQPFASPLMDDADTPNPGFTYLKSTTDNKVWALNGDKVVVYQAPVSIGTAPTTTIGPTLNVLGGGQVVFDRGNSIIRGLAPTPDGSFLWISQPSLNRVLRVRNPLSIAPIIDIVLGQADLTSTQCNRGGARALNSLCFPGALSIDRQGNLYVSDHFHEFAGNKRLLMYSSATFQRAPTSVIFGPNATKEFPASQGFATWEPAFDSVNHMVVGYNPYTGKRFVEYFLDPTGPSTVADGQLGDFYGWPVAATFDSSDNLYMYDANRGQVRIYQHPFGPTITPTPTPTPTLPTCSLSVSPTSIQPNQSATWNITSNQVGTSAIWFGPDIPAGSQVPGFSNQASWQATYTYGPEHAGKTYQRYVRINYSDGRTCTTTTVSLTIVSPTPSPSPTPTPSPKPTTLFNIRVTPTATSATVTWNTTVSLIGEVHYGTTTSYGSVVSDGPYGSTSHSINLTGLSGNTLYHYNLRSFDDNDNLVGTTGDLTFTTNP